MVSSHSSTVADLLATYIAMWNERDTLTRQRIGAGLFTADARYVDPTVSARGVAAIDAHVVTWQEQFPGMVFTIGAVHSHHDVAHFGWSFGPPGGSPVGSGSDTVTIADGRLATVYGFFD
ncbi:nuclear transport factor 2 family protein [Nocardia cyriacigeorgica]|uniref:Nuclear transport factor 2 family protein n=1 Tax=Nocardia cyriacigeorgica TaxID=135487 RepID=A0A5R8P0W9_9NOCA|nr:nuclear transport factor 2 family protein [Nocardia cyriacigeorgica]TLF82514.1 nuclear transport factor 2 family protein [Nocardia cyriacigeorgica]